MLQLRAAATHQEHNKKTSYAHSHFIALRILFGAAPAGCARQLLRNEATAAAPLGSKTLVALTCNALRCALFAGEEHILRTSIVQHLACCLRFTDRVGAGPKEVCGRV